MYRVYRLAENYLHGSMGFRPKYRKISMPFYYDEGLRKISFKLEAYCFLSSDVFNWNFFFLHYDGHRVVCGNYLSSTGKCVRNIHVHAYVCIRYVSYMCLRRIKHLLHRNSPGVSAPRRSFHKCVYGHTIIIIILLIRTDRLWSGGHTHTHSSKFGRYLIIPIVDTFNNRNTHV